MGDEFTKTPKKCEVFSSQTHLLRKETKKRFTNISRNLADSLTR